ncbi:MAG: hypothetical protein CFE21_03645 [Bacteroidetes bacterium B1(2017)]|nr:MAG: hypothetical protein CFE21_03645 [Bacteroidetes bacterium B1(2017)]
MLTHLVACVHSDKSPLKQVTWTGSSHTYGDTFYSEGYKDTLINIAQVYVAHSISFDQNGDGILITRKEYNAPREYYKIFVPDSTRNIVFKLLQDTSVLNFKMPTYDPEKVPGRLYCGFNYLISYFENYSQEKNINYLPPDATPKLESLDLVFKSILDKPTIIGKTQVDTLTFDSILLAKVLYFNPGPPLRSKVKFTPPEIKGED